MQRPSSPKLRHKLGLTAVAVLLLFILALLPFALSSVVTDILQPSTNHVYRITPAGTEPAETRSHLQLDINSLDEWQHLVTIQVSGTHVCHAQCPWNDRFLLISAYGSDVQVEGLPPSQAVTFPGSAMELTQRVTLPISGDPIRYPFDHYRLVLGIIMQRVYPDGTTANLSPQEAAGHLFLSLQMRVAGQTIGTPQVIDPGSMPIALDNYTYVYVEGLQFQRPVYLRVLTILLVLLVSAAAAYAVFLRPLNELVINSGALVLGVWGIRSILVGATPPGTTAVDLALAVVILFLLAAITVRAFHYLQEASDIHIRRRRPAERRELPEAEDGRPIEGVYVEPGQVR